MPNRILIGNTGSSTGDFPEEYHRQDNTGVYISRPGFDALTCNATDLLFSTDGTQSGFLQVLASGSALLDVSPELGTPFELKIEGLDIEAPRHSGPGTGGDSPVMVQWFIAAGLGKDFGSNVYDAMGGQGTDSWDGDGVDSYGLPNGYNPLHTGEWEHGGRKAFWQYPNDHPYHLSNTCITNDPSAFNFAWWQTPVSPENLEDALNWGLSTDTFDPYDPDAGPGMIQENIDIGGFDVFVGGVMEALFSIGDSTVFTTVPDVSHIRIPGWENWEATCSELAISIEKYKFRDALQEQMNLSRLGNKYLADKEPWKIIKTPNAEKVKTIMNISIQICGILTIGFPTVPSCANHSSELQAINPLPSEPA